MNDVAPSEQPDSRVQLSINSRLAAAFGDDPWRHRGVVSAVYGFYPDLLTPAGHPETSAISAESKAVAGYFTDLVRAGLDGEWTRGSFMGPELGSQRDELVAAASALGWDLDPSYTPDDRDRRLGLFQGALESAIERMPWVVDTFRGDETDRDANGGRRSAAMKRIGSDYDLGPILAYAAGFAGFPPTVVPPFIKAENVPGQVVVAAGRYEPTQEHFRGEPPAIRPTADPALHAEAAQYVGIATTVADSAVRGTGRHAAARAAEKVVSPPHEELASAAEGGSGESTSRDTDSGPAVRRTRAKPHGPQRRN